MAQKKSLSFVSRKKSFSYAINGIRLLVAREPNAKLHTVATIAVIALGIVRHISPLQWVAIIVAIGLVWITETLNTCIEELCNYACENKTDPAIKIIKDMAAGAVLIATIASVVIGVIVFVFS